MVPFIIPMKATLLLPFLPPFLCSTPLSCPPFPSPLSYTDQQGSGIPADAAARKQPLRSYSPVSPLSSDSTLPCPSSRLQISKDLVSKLPPPPQQPADQELLFVMRPDPNRLPASAVTSLLQVWAFEFEFHTFEIGSDAPHNPSPHVLPCPFLTLSL